MKAVILAAGIGSRLRSITDEKCKTLVEVNGLPMISHILNSLSISEITEIILCCGYKADQLKNYVKKTHEDLNIIFVENNEYDITNNMYSLYLSKELLTEDFILMNADLVFDPSIIKEMVSIPKNIIAVEKGNYLVEAMQIIVEDGVIKTISKQIGEKLAFGSSIDIYRIQKDTIPVILEEMKKIIVELGDRNQWTEKMLDNLFRSGRVIFKPFDIEGRKWYEIDDDTDLANAEMLFNDKLGDISKIKVFFIDRDGTLTNENKKIPGTDLFLEAIQKRKKKFYILTNNSSKTPEQHYNTFINSDLNIELGDVLVSTQSAIKYLKSQDLIKLFWVANQSVSDFLTSQGFIFTTSDPQALLLTYDTEINYAKIKTFVNLVRKDVPYYATHIDTLCPSLNGPLPDIGTFINLIQTTTGKTPLKTFGKPNLEMIKGKLTELNLDLKNAVIIGDRLYTDIKMAAGNELTSILVFTGETTRKAYEKSEIKADIVCNSLVDLIDFL